MILAEADVQPAVLLHLPPQDLAVHKQNVRSKVDEGLVDSVRQLGVLSPLIVTADNGAYTVVAGHRRRAAAIKAKVETVPCYVLELGDDAAAITAMLAENLARIDLSPADEAKGFEQLSAFGMTDAEIAAATSVDETIVATGLRVARSKVASKVGRQYDLTLDQSAAIAEFDGDAKVVKELTSVAQKRPAQFDHAVAHVRAERDRLAKRAKLIAQLTADGVKINKDNDRPGYDIGSKHGCELTSLRDDKGKEITVVAHKECPGHGAYIGHWGDGVEYLCRAPRKYGHKSYYSSGTRGATAELSPAEKEKASTERRKLIANNKAMDSATPVRRKFVKDLLARKVAPKGTLAFVTPIVVDDPYLLRAEGGSSSMLTDLTGHKSSHDHNTAGPLAKESVGATDARRQVLLLAAIAVAIEGTWPRDVWRRHKPLRSGQYLQFLASCGYGLADIEKLVIHAAGLGPDPKIPVPAAKTAKPTVAKKAGPAKKKAAPVKAAAKKRVPVKRRAVKR